MIPGVVVYLAAAGMAATVVGAVAADYGRTRPPVRHAHHRGRLGALLADPGDATHAPGTAGHPDSWLVPPDGRVELWVGPW